MPESVKTQWGKWLPERFKNGLKAGKGIPRASVEHPMWKVAENSHPAELIQAEIFRFDRRGF
jgi:hypothetical protein